MRLSKFAIAKKTQKEEIKKEGEIREKYVKVGECVKLNNLIAKFKGIQTS